MPSGGSGSAPTLPNDLFLHKTFHVSSPETPGPFRATPGLSRSLSGAFRGPPLRPRAPRFVFFTQTIPFYLSGDSGALPGHSGPLPELPGGFPGAPAPPPRSQMSFLHKTFHLSSPETPGPFQATPDFSRSFPGAFRGLPLRCHAPRCHFYTKHSILALRRLRSLSGPLRTSPGASREPSGGSRSGPTLPDVIFT